MPNSLDPLRIFLSEKLESSFGSNLTAMAKRVGIHRNQLDRYIKGAIAPTTESLDQIAAAFGVSAAFLIASSEERLALTNRASPTVLARIEAIEAKLTPATVQTPQSDIVDRIAAQLRDLPEPALRSVENILKPVLAAHSKGLRKTGESGK